MHADVGSALGCLCFNVHADSRARRLTSDESPAVGDTTKTLLTEIQRLLPRQI